MRQIQRCPGAAGMDQGRCDTAVQTLRRPVGLRGVFFCLNAQIHPRIFVHLSRRIDLLCVRFRVINTLQENRSSGRKYEEGTL